MKKKWIVLSLLAALCLLLSGCAAKTETASQAASTSSKEVVEPEASQKSEAVSEGADESSTPQSSQASANPENDQYIIDDNDPHKSDKEAILAIVRELVNGEEFLTTNITQQSIFFTQNLKPRLEEHHIIFKFNTQLNGIYGTFADNARWGFKLDGLITVRPEKNMAKRSDSEEENKKLDKILKKITDLIQSEEYQKMSKGEQIKEIRNLQTNEAVVNPDSVLSYNISMTGINGQFSNGTKWGYTYEELTDLAAASKYES